MAAELREGDRVYSPRFGRGTVARVEPPEAGGRVTIRFESGGETTVADPAALRLERIDPRPVPSAPASPAPSAGGPAMDREELRRLLAEAVEQIVGPVDAELGDRWRGGRMVLKPGREGTQSKEVPLEAFFQKIIRIRDQLRVLEQKVNGHPALAAEDKLTLQQYITRCYGTLTTFNVLFKDPEDRFVGSGSGD